MTRLADRTETQFAAAEIQTSLTGRKCWYAYTSIGNTFQIALGRKVARDSAEVAAIDRLREKRLARLPAKGGRSAEDTLSREFDRFTGESNLLVWCAWRLDGPKGPVTSWDDEVRRCEAGIGRLIGRSVRQVTINESWYLLAAFSGGLTMHVFPHHVGPGASFDGNWEVWRPADAFLIGTDLSCKVVAREKGPFRARIRPAHGDIGQRAKFRRLRMAKRVPA